MRLFVALELDDQAQALLGDYQWRLEGLNRTVRWIDPVQIHLTLQFLGEVEDARVPAIAQALDELVKHDSFEFQIQGVGTFGSPRTPRVVWAGVRMPNPPLMNLQKDCEERLADLGFEPEERGFRPHLTLGRVKDLRAGQLVNEAIETVRSQGSRVLTQRASRVILFESVLRPQGAQYVAVHKVLLGKG